MRQSKFTVSATLALAFGFGSFGVTASSLGGPTYTLETMMNTQLMEQLLIESANTWNVSDTVSYSYSYNNSTGAFSFSTDPGQSIGGLSFSSSTSATYDATQSTWTYSASGLIGANMFQITGDANITGDPLVSIYGDYTDSSGKLHVLLAKVEITYPDPKDRDHFVSKGTITGEVGVENSNLEGKSITDKGERVPPFGLEKWMISMDFAPQNGPPTIWAPVDHGSGHRSMVNPNQVQGQFTQQVVPEPSSLILFASAIPVLILAYLRVDRRLAIALTRCLYTGPDTNANQNTHSRRVFLGPLRRRICYHGASSD